MSGENSQKLSKLALGLSFGVVWGLSVFFMGLLAMCCQYGQPFVDAIGSFYIGYEATWLGSLIGALWGFVDFFLFGFFIALFYNIFLCCRCCCPFSKKDK